MQPPENSDLPELKAAAGSVVPASITLVPPPRDLDYLASGVVSLSGSADFFGGISATQTFSWRISGTVESSLSSSWKVGDGEYYWYRVQGECDQVGCDNFGVGNVNCNPMTFVTVVAARNLPELCENMTSPFINAPVQTRIISVQRYSRPVLRVAGNELDCNILTELQICQIPECEEYCLDDRIVVDIPLSFSVMMDVFLYDASEETELSPIVIGGSLLELTSPSFYYEPSSGLEISGGFNLEDLGIISVDMAMSASVFGFGYDFEDVSYGSPLTISQSNAPESCGCSPVGLTLTVDHNLSKSSILNSFLFRNNLSLPSRISMGYNFGDSSWRFFKKFSGIWQDGQQNDISILLSLACSVDRWKFVFCAKSNQAETKAIFEMPSNLVCELGGNISTNFQLDIQDGDSSNNSGERIFVVTPNTIRPQPRTPFRGVQVYADGILIDHLVYYDELGLFSDTFWRSVPLEFDINKASRQKSQILELQRIFR